MRMHNSMLVLLVSAFFVLIGCAADINFKRAINVYDGDANLLTNIASDVEFDSILITTTTPETFTIENIGGSELYLEGDPIVEISSDGDLAFSVITMPETTIKPGESTTFTIEFAPTVSKYYEATVSIITNDTDMSPFTFTISGTGLEPGINVKQGEIYKPNNTGNYDFGNFRVLETTSEVTFTIENSGTYELNLTGTPMIEISGTDADLFTLNDSALSSPIAPDSSTTFTLTFTPDSEGLKEATITIANDDFNKAPYVLTVRGTGVQPEINVKQGTTDLVSGTDSYVFGNVRVSETSSEIVFTIENLGTDTLNLTGSPIVEVTGTDATMFTVTETMTKSAIPADSSTAFVISFSPTSDGIKTATISIANDDFDENPYTFEITGTGTIPEINVKQGGNNIVSSTGGYDFGIVMRTRSSKPVLFTIENTGTADLLLTGTPKISITGTGASDFVINQTLTDSPVLPSKSTTFEVTFSPTSVGKKTATISIANDDSDENPYTFTVTGKTTTFDFNGDGYDDVIVGADGDNYGGAYAGCAFIIFGRSNPSNVIDAAYADVRLIGVKSGDSFGRSVSSAGDINGDGYDDVIVGAPNDNDGETYSGSAFIFLGSSNPHTSIDASLADVKLTNSGYNAHFGYSVSGAGDINGDGYDDVIVGAYGAHNRGSAYIFYGSSSLSSTIDSTSANVKLNGQGYNDTFGCSVSCTGDLNGDGYNDAIVGAHYDSDGGSQSGCAFIFYGGASMSSEIDASNADVKLVGEDSGDYFGTSVTIAADVNGDGFDDVIVGGDENVNNGRKTGAAYIFFGKQNMLSYIDAMNADVKLFSSNTNDYFGCSVSSAGDVNGDGFNDMIIGAYFADRGGESSGSAFIVFGNSTFVSIMSESYLDVDIYGNSGDYLGFGISGAGDFNGDGYADVIIGAYGDDDGGSMSGCAFIVAGNSQFSQNFRSSEARVRLIGINSDDCFGISVGGGR